MRKQTDERYDEKRGLVVGVGQQIHPEMRNGVSAWVLVSRCSPGS
jgi:hypothetical protein